MMLGTTRQARVLAADLCDFSRCYLRAVARHEIRFVFGPSD
jgi:hypothetical protein